MSFDAWDELQDHRSGDSSHGNRLYVYEKCTNRKNLYRNRVGMPPVILLPSSENLKNWRRITERSGSGIVI